VLQSAVNIVNFTIQSLAGKEKPFISIPELKAPAGNSSIIDKSI
jgi:hypothetical protein